jgi:hypothetical protein
MHLHGIDDVYGLAELEALGRFRRHDRTSALLVETVIRGLMEQLLVSIIAGLPTQWASAPPIRNV